jgi:hypothetical protein
LESESTVHMPMCVAEDIGILAHHWRDNWKATFTDVERYQKEDEYYAKLSNNTGPNKND